MRCRSSTCFGDGALRISEDAECTVTLRSKRHCKKESSISASCYIFFFDFYQRGGGCRVLAVLAIFVCREMLSCFVCNCWRRSRGSAMTMREAVAVVLLVVAVLFKEVAAIGVLSSACLTDADCGPGLYCFSCEGAAPVCIANQALPVSSFAQTYSLPYNKYAWITTHNAFAIEGQPSILGTSNLSPKNQEDAVTSQLNRGVRGLMLDIYEFQGDLWLCHSLSACYTFTAFRPLDTVLTEIELFLATNPNEVITIFIEDYVSTPNALSNHFTATGLTRYMFPLANMPNDGRDWPTVASMIASNHRLVVFTSDSSKEAIEGIAYQWNYVLENQYGTVEESCFKRSQSSDLTDPNKSLLLQNYFPNNPNMTGACLINSGYLAQAVTVCYGAAGNRWPNFLAVDFYKRSTAGGVFSAIDKLNGQHHCGCDDIRACQGSTGRGVCSAVTQHAALSTPAGSLAEAPVASPTEAPVASPTKAPVASPTEAPVASPTKAPAAGPKAEAPAAPSPESSSTYITTSKLILSLPFLISFFLST